VVEIRKLQPSIQIGLPPKRKDLGRNWRGNADKKRTTRWRKDYPPPTPQPTPCVIWQGAVDKHGYGKRKYRPEGKDEMIVIGTHRWIVEFALGRRLRPDEVIMHLCDNPPCFRHDHLVIGTIQENNADRHKKGRTKQTPQHMHGETNGRAKLTRKQTALIKIDYSAGVGISELARRHKVSRPTIYRVLKGLTWKEQLDGDSSGTVARPSGDGES